jgi:hypothetical protein
MHRVYFDPHQGAHQIADPCSTNMVETHLYPYFLGPYGENDALLEKLVIGSFATAHAAAPPALAAERI